MFNNQFNQCFDHHTSNYLWIVVSNSGPTESGKPMRPTSTPDKLVGIPSHLIKYITASAGKITVDYIEYIWTFRDQSSAGSGPGKPYLKETIEKISTITGTVATLEQVNAVFDFTTDEKPTSPRFQAKYPISSAKRPEIR